MRLPWKVKGEAQDSLVWKLGTKFVGGLFEDFFASRCDDDGSKFVLQQSSRKSESDTGSAARNEDSLYVGVLVFHFG